MPSHPITTPQTLHTLLSLSPLTPPLTAIPQKQPPCSPVKKHCNSSTYPSRILQLTRHGGTLTTPQTHATKAASPPSPLTFPTSCLQKAPHLTFSLSSTLHKIPFFPRLILVLPLNRRLACHTQQSRLSSFPFPPSRKNQATAHQSFPLTHHAHPFLHLKPLASAPPNKRLSSVSFPFKHHLSQTAPPQSSPNEQNAPPSCPP